MPPQLLPRWHTAKPTPGEHQTATHLTLAQYWEPAVTALMGPGEGRRVTTPRSRQHLDWDPQKEHLTHYQGENTHHFHHLRR